MKGGAMDNGRATGSSASIASFLEADSNRWRPLRSGLLNFYRYDQQEFHFHHGRLLLRGHNGTGKSRVLALQLPFLLDGEISPHRVEPDRDPAKRFEWNLLMGKYEDRVGYTWIEFGRQEAEAGEQYITLGCGVRAVAGRGIVSKWFFITTRRIGYDLKLCSSQSSPLTRDSLEEALGSYGRIYTTAAEYRQDVNVKLFGLPQARYEELINLLIQLRQPKLSKDLDEEGLSAVLSGALSPVSPRIIEQVAEAMRGLEDERVALESLQSAKQTADSFLHEYRKYVSIVASRRADEVRKAHSTFEARQRKLKQTSDDLENAQQGHKEAVASQESNARDLAGFEAQKQVLENSPQMRSARDLDAAEHRAIERRNEVEAAGNEHQAALKAMSDASVAVDRNAEYAMSAATNLATRSKESSSASAVCGVEKTHASIIEKLNLENLGDIAEIGRAEERLTVVIKDRRAAAKVLRLSCEQVGQAKSVQAQEIRRRDEEFGRVAEADDALIAGNGALEAAVRDLKSGSREWITSATMLSLPPVDELVAEIDLWCEAGCVTTSPISRAASAALTEFQRIAANDRSEQQQRLKVIADHLDEILDERDRLRQGEHQPPPIPYTRDEQSRHSRSGAPLWKLCDFRDTVSTERRAGLEAAMESAGLLDAWINPDGSVFGNDAFDTFLSVATNAPATEDATLLDVMTIESDAVVAREVVERLLRRISLGESGNDCWLTDTGHWRIGPRTGHWKKPQATHIGHAAREIARLKRLRELDEEIASSEKTRAQIVDSIARIGGSEVSAQAHAHRVPRDDTVRSAIAKRDLLQLSLHQAKLRFTEAEQRANAAQTSLDEAIKRRDAVAIDLGLTAWINNLDELNDSLTNYQGLLSRLWPAMRESIGAQQALAEAQARHADTRDRAERLAKSMQEAVQKSAAADAEAAALRSSVGAEVKTVQVELRKIVVRLAAVKEKEKELYTSIGGFLTQIDLLQENIRTLKSELDQDVAARDQAIAHFLQFTKTGLLGIASDELAGEERDDISVTAAVELARRAGTSLRNVDSSEMAWQQNQKSIYGHIQDLTSALQSRDYRPEYTAEADVLVVTVPFQGAPRNMKDFGQLIAEEIVNRRALLSAKEREVLENYLIHDAAVELGQLMRRAEEIVRDMNKQLRTRPTSTGMMLQFRWEPISDGPSAFAEARQRLLGDSSTWSPTERNALGAFLQEEIQKVRESEMTSGNWHEQLAKALDYRRWHVFQIDRKQDGKWQRLTRRTHGTGSGGEKAVALTIPQFAAAAAYYQSASKQSPRLILLDEVFVGIDPDMRSKCMGLLHQFDLDFVMTSELEWGCYQTMPGLAIYQLSAKAGIDAVLATRWVWNGRERVPCPATLPLGLADCETRNGSREHNGDDGDATGLFGNAGGSSRNGP
jgi:uncharacterized protein (TIGR02680 family)